MTHFDEIVFLRYLEGQLEPHRAAEVRAHLDGCVDCRRFVEGLEAETRLLREALQEADEELSAAPASGPAEEMSWTLASVVGSLAAGLYVFWKWMVVPWWDGLETAGFGPETLLSVLLFRGALWEGWSMMGELIRNAALAGTAVAIVVLAWRFSRRQRASLPMLMATVVLSVCAPAVEAAVIERGREAYVLPEGEVLDNDLIVMARSATIEGTVRGDLIAFAQTTTVRGRVTGDVLAATQRLHIEGEVEGNVRSFSEFLDIVGRVHRNVTAAGESVRVERGATVGGSMIVGSEEATLEGEVAGDVIIASESPELNGSLGGSALVAAALLRIGPRADIAGPVEVYATRQPEVSPEARLAGGLDVSIREPERGLASPKTYVRFFLRWAAAFLFGVVLLLALPRWWEEVRRNTERAGISFLAGAAALVVAPIVTILVGITLVGIPVSLVLLFLYLAALYGAQVLVGAWLGARLLGEPAGRGQSVGRLALGLAILHLAGRLPYVGGLVSLAVILWGLGALTLWLFQSFTLRPAAA